MLFYTRKYIPYTIKEGPDSNPFFGPKKNLLCFPLAIQSKRHVQGQAITVDLTQIHPLHAA